jgi:hypothetical protein
VITAFLNRLSPSLTSLAFFSRPVSNEVCYSQQCASIFIYSYNHLPCSNSEFRARKPKVVLFGTGCVYISCSLRRLNLSSALIPPPCIRNIFTCFAILLYQNEQRTICTRRAARFILGHAAGHSTRTLKLPLIIP